MKRQKAESNGISKLPAHILQHILSFLSQRKAVRTCVLSKSWRHLGTTRPKFSFHNRYRNIRGNTKKFRNILNKSLQVYYDQKLCIKDFLVWTSLANPELLSLLEKWIPIVIHVFGVKKFDLSFNSREGTCFDLDLPSAVFESEPLQELFLDGWNLRRFNSFGKHLKTLYLSNVDVDEETFANVLSSCPLIERFALYDCKGSFRTIKMHNHHNLKSFELHNNVGRIETYLPSTIGNITINCCRNCFHHRNYFPGLTCLYLKEVPLSDEWFNSFSRNFPCLEDLRLKNCNGFVELKLSSRSIKNLDITMDESTIKATIDAPSIKKFFINANISQSISLTATTFDEWNSQIDLSLDELDASQWFLKLSELIAAFSQSHIHSLVLYHRSGSGKNQHNIEHLSDISVCCSSYKMPVAVKSLDMVNFDGLYCDSFFSGLFCIIRPREIKQFWNNNAKHDYPRKKNEDVQFVCKILQMGRWEDEGMRSFWQEDLEEASLEVLDEYGEEWQQPVQGTTSWPEYVAAFLAPLKSDSYGLRFRLKWKELAN